MSVSVTRTLTLKSPTLPRFRTLHSPNPKFSVSFRARRIVLPPHQASSSQRVFSFAQGGSNFVDDPRARRRPISWDEEEVEDDENDDDEDRSLDLLLRFVENVFKKLSKRATKSVRSVLPVPISANLVGFSVNGILVLALLWILKAFLQVVCTLGSVVFISILLIRGIWSGVSFLQESRNRKVDELLLDPHAWNGVQPVS